MILRFQEKFQRIAEMEAGLFEVAQGSSGEEAPRLVSCIAEGDDAEAADLVPSAFPSVEDEERLGATLGNANAEARYALVPSDDVALFRRWERAYRDVRELRLVHSMCSENVEIPCSTTKCHETRDTEKIE